MKSLRFLSVFFALTVVFQFIQPAAYAATSETEYTVNVKTLGAAGNGIANDSKAFALAFTKVTEHKGGTVIVPPGTYLLDSGAALYITSNVSLVGQSNPTIKFKNFSSTYKFGYESIDIRGSNIKVEGVTIDGNSSMSRGIGIHSGSTDVLVSKTVVKNMTQSKVASDPHYSALISGILIYSQTSDITIDNSIIKNISAIHKHPVARGIMVYAQDNLPYAQRIKITNNYITNITPRNDADGIYFDYPSTTISDSNSLVDNNRLDHTAKRGIKIAAPGVVVSNNHVINSYLNNNKYRFTVSDAVPQDMFSGISVYANNVTVTNNVIDGVGSYYAGIEADLGSLSNITIKNNTISNGSGATIKNTNGIRLGVIANFNVESNKISNAWTGIYSPITLTQVGTITSNSIDKTDFGIRFSLYTNYANSKVVLSSNNITARKLKIEALPH
ncbi:hypothetical protein [Paenibacillus sp. YAF4_2]|uniref:hypothetical protein n=1 Tax=Paenibacillus sp. YAF4_2 TaxID=3233085 RepID=UPI003F9573C7